MIRRANHVTGAQVDHPILRTMISMAVTTAHGLKRGKTPTTQKTLAKWAIPNVRSKMIEAPLTFSTLEEGGTLLLLLCHYPAREGQ